MKRIDIVHVYPGSAGTAGMYVNEIYKTLKQDFNQICIVNYYFPFNYGRKIFYRFTESVGKNYFHKFSKLRLYIRMFELMLSLSYSLIIVYFNRPRIINYSMTSNFYIEYLFLKLINLSKRTMIIITCHDVMPFHTFYSDFEKESNKRTKFYVLADYLLIHNKNSKEDLVNFYKINPSKIISHDFPIMDLKHFPLTKVSKIDLIPEFKKKILFVGHARLEKGLEVLIDAWKLDVPKNLHLTVASKIPFDSKFKFSEIQGKNFTLIDKYLSDAEYVSIIKHHDFVILPYTKGTNSGIPSSVLSQGSIPVCSDISMFQNNELLSKYDLFKAGSSKALFDKLVQLSLLSEIEIKEKQKTMLKNYNKYRLKFSKNTIFTYKKIFDLLNG